MQLSGGYRRAEASKTGGHPRADPTKIQLSSHQKRCVPFQVFEGQLQHPEERSRKIKTRGVQLAVSSRKGESDPSEPYTDWGVQLTKKRNHFQTCGKRDKSRRRKRSSKEKTHERVFTTSKRAGGTPQRGPKDRGVLESVRFHLCVIVSEWLRRWT